MTETRVSAALLAGRLLLATWFVVELVDKVRRFDGWVDVVGASGLPAPAAAMGLVVVLLAVGSASIVSGYRARVGVACLLTFLVPTALLFESPGGALRAVSIAGGLVLLAAVGPGAWSVDTRLGRD